MDAPAGHEGKDLLSTVFLTSPDATLLSELETGKLVEVNGEFTHATGYERSEAVGRTVTELNAWAEPEDRRAFVKLLAETGKVKGFEARIRLKWGEVRLFQLSAARVDLDGRPCVVTIMRDVQDRTHPADTRQL